MPVDTDPDLTGFQLELPYELGRYRLEAEIGRGGMGIVYHAEDTMLERAVAVKVLLPQLAADASFVQRFKREAQMAARLEHPNIVTVHDVGQVEGLVYFVMRLVTGKPLDYLIDEGLAWSRAESIAIQVADAMAYAHEHAVIHRDIKPENVIVGKDGAVTITDFGLARPEQSASGPTQAGIILGTPGYMAPEQALGKDVDARADIYAFGVMLYELITGDLPYDGETAFSIINQHISAPPPDLSKLRPETPAYLSELVAKLMAKEKDDRPQSMREVSETLRSKQGSATRAATPAGEAAGPAGDSGSAASVVEQVRQGRISLAQAIQDFPEPEIRQTLQEAFRRELTVASLDLAGSTALKQSSGGTIAIGPVFNAYRMLVEKALKEHHCLESIWAGDGTVALFETPSEAVGAAQMIVKELGTINKQFPDTPDLGVRIGIHTGSVLRDPNQELGQVTSTTLDMTGHIQKDAKVGLVEVSQETLDKLPSAEGWIRIRTARDANLAIYAWHPEGPDKVPQSWIQRIRYGGHGGEDDKGDERVDDRSKPDRTDRAARTTKPRAATRTTHDIPTKLTCLYCGEDVTQKQQKCPSCGRLNRHYDPSQDPEARKRAKASAARRTTATSVKRRTTMIGEATGGPGDSRRTTAPRAAATSSSSTRAGQAPEKKKDDMELVGEAVLGAAMGIAVWLGVAWVLATKVPVIWWITSGATPSTNWFGLILSALVPLGMGLGMRSQQPAIGAGVLFGMPVAAILLRSMGWWI